MAEITIIGVGASALHRKYVARNMRSIHHKRPVRLGIIICDRYRTCAAGKCLRAMRRREGAFSIYRDKNIELVGYATCGGFPGGNIEYAPAEMKNNGAEVIGRRSPFSATNASWLLNRQPENMACPLLPRELTVGGG